MNVAIRRLAVAVGVLLLVAASAGSALAAAPVQFRFTETVSFTDDTSCSFPIALNFQVDIVGRVFFDAQGNFQSAIVQQNVIGTDSANGKTLSETDHNVDFFNAAGYDKTVGLPIHVRLSGGGVVIRDAGYVLFDPDGSVAFIRGPHPQLEGNTAALCAALS